MNSVYTVVAKKRNLKRGLKLSCNQKGEKLCFTTLLHHVISVGPKPIIVGGMLLFA